MQIKDLIVYKKKLPARTAAYAESPRLNKSGEGLQFPEKLHQDIKFSEGQRNDINFAVPVLEPIDIDGSKVTTDRGYDSSRLIDYIYGRGGEPNIPSRKCAKFERHCDWWLYKERHLVENYFLKLKSCRRIATRYDKLASTYLGFVYIASILIWLK